MTVTPPTPVPLGAEGCGHSLAKLHGRNGWFLRILAGYRMWVSPLIGPCCRFEPSCSEYAQAAFTHLSAARASWLVCRRLLRCHPFCRGGLDPVPGS